MSDHTADLVRAGYRVEVQGKARYMTVGDLRAILAQGKANDDAHVMLWSDAEGNQIRNLLEVQIGHHAIELVPFD